MTHSLLVAAVIAAPAAPIPKDTVPNTTGPAPRIIAVKADTTGAVWISASVYEKRKIQQNIAVNENGKIVVKQQEVEQMVSNYIRKTLGDFGGKFATADGTPLTTEDAVRRVKDGATLLVTADGKPVDKGWLKAVASDTLIMQAEGLAEAHFQFGATPLPTTAAPRLAMLSTDEKGEVRLPVNPNGGNAGGQVYYDDNFGGRVRFAGRGRIIQNNADIDFGGVAPPPSSTPAGSDGKKPLAELKFEAYDVNGKLVPRTEALSRLKAGGLVVIAGDNRAPDADYLKAFRDDILVLVSGELVFPAGMPNPYDYRPATKPAAVQTAKPAPAQPQAVPQIAPPIQLQIQPGVIKRVQVQIEK